MGGFVSIRNQYAYSSSYVSSSTNLVVGNGVCCLLFFFISKNTYLVIHNFSGLPCQEKGGHKFWAMFVKSQRSYLYWSLLRISASEFSEVFLSDFACSEKFLVGSGFNCLQKTKMMLSMEQCWLACWASRGWGSTFWSLGRNSNSKFWCAMRVIEGVTLLNLVINS